ncbi:MAG: chemotaxis protein CheW [Pseudomonadota bacterium]
MSTPAAAQEYLIVSIADSLFALRAEDVESAVAPRNVTPLPYVPAYVEGLVGINDRVLPLIDLRRLLLPDSPAAGQSELVVVETARVPCALRVDRVVATALVDGAQLDVAVAAADDTGTTTGRLVAGRFTHDGHTVLVMDRDALGHLVSAEETAPGRRGLLGRLSTGIRRDAARTEACIVVTAGEEIYGIALAEALEILDIGRCAPVPGAPALVEGVALVRGEALLVLSLGRVLGRSETTNSRSIVVIERGEARYGLRVDVVEGILPYGEGDLRPVEGEGGELAGIVVDGERAIGLLDAARLLGEARRRLLAPFTPARARVDRLQEEETRALLEVDVAGEILGIPLASVRRIARYSASLVLDEDDGDDDGSRVSGAVNIEGAILPVLDLQDTLGLTETAIGNYGAWVVVGVEGREWALPVNEARRIVDVPLSAVESFADGGGRLVQAVARVNERLISLLSIEPLLEDA